MKHSSMVGCLGLRKRQHASNQAYANSSSLFRLSFLGILAETNSTHEKCSRFKSLFQTSKEFFQSSSRCSKRKNSISVQPDLPPLPRQSRVRSQECSICRIGRHRLKMSLKHILFSPSQCFQGSRKVDTVRRLQAWVVLEAP